MAIEQLEQFHQRQGRLGLAVSVAREGIDATTKACAKRSAPPARSPLDELGCKLSVVCKPLVKAGEVGAILQGGGDDQAVGRVTMVLGQQRCATGDFPFNRQAYDFGTAESLIDPV